MAEPTRRCVEIGTARRFAATAPPPQERFYGHPEDPLMARLTACGAGVAGSGTVTAAPFRRRWRVPAEHLPPLVWTIASLLALAVRLPAVGQDTPPALPAGSPPSANRPADVVVSAACVWSDTGIDVRAGQWLRIRASGSVVVRYRLASGLRRRALTVGPQGTYLVDDDVMRWPFPLPAGLHGPAPCFALMARIGDGNPLLIGERRTLRAPRSGRLYLGINDPLPDENSGHWHVSIETVARPEPLAFEWRRHAAPVEWIVQRELQRHGRARPVGLFAASAPAVAGAEPDGADPARIPAGPLADRVVVFYLDGLRPDVVREMALAGHLPTIRKHFVEGGTWLANTFTAFPSDTITSNGTMWTGCFSDRHGLKGQVEFDRHRRSATSFLDRLGPARSAR
ncbi:MAG: hypothetical protein D6725_16510, partial [Planctomycetota bacterium]